MSVNAERKSAGKEKAVTLLCAFFIPVILSAAAFAAVGVYPFGDKSMLIIDMHNEYIDYLAQMNESIRDSGSFFRSWNMGMGLNMLGLIAFYTSSPFNLIILLLPLKYITEAVFAVTLLKLGLCGLLFAVYERNVFPGAGQAFHVAFAAAYALSAYNIVYSSNIMWLDGSAFLPLVLLGVERILKEGRYRLFLLGLVYVFFTSYYIGYMIGVFSFLYFTARYFSDNNDLRAYLGMLWRFAASAALAACCLAFLLLPAFLNLRHSQIGMWDIPFEPELRYPFVKLAAKLLPGAYDTLTDYGLPNIYCTVLAVSLLFLYFCTGAVKLREKLIFGGLLGFLLLSFSCGFLDIAWHAFEDPTWFPARYSFVFSFLLLYFSLRCAVVLGSITRREIAAALGLLLLLFVEIGVNRFRFAGIRAVITAVTLACIYAAILAAWNKKYTRALPAMLAFFVCVECFGNAAALAIGLDDQFEYDRRGEYLDFMQSYGAAVKRVSELDTGVYRMEILRQRGANGGMALGYNGISHYSTTTDQALNSFLRDLGYNIGTINELRFSASTPPTNGLLGIRYVLSPESMGASYTLIEDVNGIGIYENPAAWPLAFWAPTQAAELSPDASSGPFEMQNKILSALSGGEAAAFIPIEPEEEKLTNIEKTIKDNHVEYERQIRNQSAAVEFRVKSVENNEVFAFFPVHDRRFSGSEVFVDDEFVTRDFSYRSNTIIPLGGGEHTLKIVPGGESVPVSGAYFAMLDIEAAKSAATKAAAHKLEFTKFHDTAVEGRIIAPEDGVLATTFPYDEGWTLRIDGERVTPSRLAGVFFSAPVTKGEHTVSMRYVPPGFKAGAVISVAAIAGILAWLFFKKGYIRARVPEGRPHRRTRSA